MRFHSQFVIGMIVLAFAAVLPMHAQDMFESKRDCSTLSKPGHYPDYEGLPKYSIVRREHDVSNPPVLLLRISMASKDMGGSALTRLGCKLASSFPEETAIDAFIFDDDKAARSLAPGFSEQVNYGIYLWHLRAHFQWDRKKSEGVIEYVVPDLHDSLLSVVRVIVRLSDSKNVGK